MGSWTSSSEAKAACGSFTFKNLLPPPTFACRASQPHGQASEQRSSCTSLLVLSSLTTCQPHCNREEEKRSRRSHNSRRQAWRGYWGAHKSSALRWNLCSPVLARLPGPVSLTECLNWDGRRAAAFCCLAKVNSTTPVPTRHNETQLRHRDDAETHMNTLQELCNGEFCFLRRSLLFCIKSWLIIGLEML